VLQGYFSIERFAGRLDRRATAQGKPRHGSSHSAISGRPGLPIYPSQIIARPAVSRPTARANHRPWWSQRGPAQAKTASQRAWPGAPRPELLPGMVMPRVDRLGPTVQARSTAGVVISPLPPGQLRLIGTGKPLDPGIRGPMESFFGADFSSVRVHEGPVAQQLGALAFTLGETLYFAPGLYDPTTREGVELLGHELTHVVQQRSGRVPGPDQPGVAIVQDPALEAEADRMGRQVAEQIASRSGAVRNPLQPRRLPGGSAAMPIAARRASRAILRMEGNYVAVLQDTDFWSYRGSNDLLYIASNNDLFIRNAGAALTELLQFSYISVYNPAHTQVLFKIQIDWSQLISIEIQTKKTIEIHGTIHVKFYFRPDYALAKFPNAKQSDITYNFKEVAQYYNDKKVGSYQEVFSSDPNINTLIVPDISAFIDQYALRLSLATTKNTYILSESYVAMIHDYKRRK
jgi:hypothetical protein